MNNNKEAINFFIKRKTELELELNSVNSALVSLQKDAKIDFSKFTVVQYISSRKIPKEYKSTLKYPDQIMWLLNLGGPQTIEEMIDTIQMIYGTEDEQQLFKGLTQAASLMYKKGEITAVKFGKSNKYSLKKKGD